MKLKQKSISVITKKKKALKRLLGAGKALNNIDPKKAIVEYLEKKYLS